MKSKLNYLYIPLVSLLLTSCGKEKSPERVGTYEPSPYCKSSGFDGPFKSLLSVCGSISLFDAFGTAIEGPFHTFIQTKYENRPEYHEINEMEEIIGKSISDLHYEFDSSNYYCLDKKACYQDVSKGEVDETKLIQNLALINDSYGTGKKVRVSDDMIAILEESFQIATLSKNAFNPAIGEVAKFWKNLIDENSNIMSYDDMRDPSDDLVLQKDLEKKTACIPGATELATYIVIDKSMKTVEFKKYHECEKVSLTFGGIGKGYAIQKTADKLIEKGYTKGVINGGSSSITTLGNHPYKEAWDIDISTPKRIKNRLGYLSTNGNFSISTSGDSEQFYDYPVSKDYKKFVYRHHIIDPNTGYPLNTYRQNLVFSRTVNAGILDALSTASFNLNENEVKKLIVEARALYGNDIEILYFIEGENNIGTIKCTEKLSELIVKDDKLKKENFIVLDY